MGKKLEFDPAEGWHDIRDDQFNLDKFPEIVHVSSDYFGTSKSNEVEVFISKNKIFRGVFCYWPHHNYKDPGRGFIWAEDGGITGYGSKKVKAWRYV